MKKTFLIIGTTVTMSVAAWAQGLTDQLDGWRLTQHGDHSQITVSELRFDASDKVAGAGCVAYDASGHATSNLWLSVRRDNLPEAVDLTQQKAAAFSYKLIARNLTGKKRAPTIRLRLGLNNAKRTGSATFSDTCVTDGEWHEMIVPVEDFKNEATAATSIDWDRTDVKHVGISQHLSALDELDYTMKIADLRFLPQD